MSRTLIRVSVLSALVLAVACGTSDDPGPVDPGPGAGEPEVAGAPGEPEGAGQPGEPEGAGAPGEPEGAGQPGELEDRGAAASPAMIRLRAGRATWRPDAAVDWSRSGSGTAADEGEAAGGAAAPVLRVLGYTSGDDGEGGVAAGDDVFHETAQGAAVLDDETRAALASLGYLGDGAIEETLPPDPPPGAGGAGTFSSTSVNDVIGVGGGAGRSYGGRAGAAPGNAVDSVEVEPVRWQPAGAAPHALRLTVGPDDALPLVGLEAHMWVEGTRARVVLDASFENPHDRQLEGRFQLRLPDGASPYYLAFGGVPVALDQPFVDAARAAFLDPSLDADLGHRPELLREHRGNLVDVKEARMVARDTARRAYTETVRRRVDPALLEWSGAGVFDARVFPLQPGGLHRVVLAYERELVHGERDAHVELALPDAPARRLVLHVREPAGVRVEVHHDGETHPVSGRFDDGWDDARAARVAVRVLAPGALAHNGPRAGGDERFSVRVVPDLPRDVVGAREQAVFLLDTSLSSRPERFAVWRDLLAQILERNREAGLRRFAVAGFDVGVRWLTEGLVPNTPAEVEALLARVDDVVLHGATDVTRAVEQVIRPEWLRAGEHADWDVFLLSDGASTWGTPRVPEVVLGMLRMAGLPVFAYVTGTPGTDRRQLDAIARETGGAVFAVTRPDEVAAAATAHTARPWRLDGVSGPGLDDVLVRGRPLHVYPGQALQLVGRGRLRAGDRLTLDLEQFDSALDVRVPVTHALDSDLAVRAYGEVAVEQLESLDEVPRDVTAAWARHHRVPGEVCSLLMLETAADYEQYDIAPEDDARVVAETRVDALVREALAARRARTSTALAAMGHFVERMQQLPGVGFALPDGLLEALSDGPAWGLTGVVRPLRPSAHLDAALRDAPLADALDEDVLPARTFDALAVELAAGGHVDDALAVLSNLLERDPANARLVREIAARAVAWERPDQAYLLLRRLADLRPAEPLTHAALARCLVDLGRHDAAVFWYEVALGGQWPARFGEFHRIVGLEQLQLLRDIVAGEREARVAAWAAERLTELAGVVEPAEADLLVTLEWTTDRTDVDLHVVDPRGERCFYGDRETALGGKLTTDVTQGFGPEMFVLPVAPSGDYALGAHYYSGDANSLELPSRVSATLWIDWGRPGASRLRRVFDLETVGEMVTLGVLTLE